MSPMPDASMGAIFGGGAPAGGQDPSAPAAAPGGGGDPGMDQARQMLEGVMEQIRSIGTQLDQLGATAPVLGPETQQARQLLKRMIIKAGQMASQQTDSSMALPG